MPTTGVSGRPTPRYTARHLQPALNSSTAQSTFKTTTELESKTYTRHADGVACDRAVNKRALEAVGTR